MYGQLLAAEMDEFPLLRDRSILRQSDGPRWTMMSGSRCGTTHSENLGLEPVDEGPEGLRGESRR